MVTEWKFSGARSESPLVAGDGEEKEKEGRRCKKEKIPPLRRSKMYYIVSPGLPLPVAVVVVVIVVAVAVAVAVAVGVSFATSIVK